MSRFVFEQHYRTLATTDGIEAAYTRNDENDVIDLTLIPASTDLEGYDLEAADIITTTQDWIILADDFNDRVGRMPEVEDRIDVDYGHTQTTFEVRHVTEERPWRYTNEKRVAIRVHSVEVEGFSE